MELFRSIFGRSRNQRGPVTSEQANEMTNEEIRQLIHKLLSNPPADVRPTSFRWIRILARWRLDAWTLAFIALVSLSFLDNRLPAWLKLLLISIGGLVLIASIIRSYGYWKYQWVECEAESGNLQLHDIEVMRWPYFKPGSTVSSEKITKFFFDTPTRRAWQWAFNTQDLIIRLSASNSDKAKRRRENLFPHGPILPDLPKNTVLALTKIREYHDSLDTLNTKLNAISAKTAREQLDRAEVAERQRQTIIVQNGLISELLARVVELLGGNVDDLMSSNLRPTAASQPTMTEHSDDGLEQPTTEPTEELPITRPQRRPRPTPSES